MVAWMNARGAALDAGDRRDALLEPQPGRAVAQGRDLRQHPAGRAGVWVDCDGDTLLVQVEPAGPACHTGAVSCFYRPVASKRTNNG